MQEAQSNFETSSLHRLKIGRSADEPFSAPNDILLKALFSALDRSDPKAWQLAAPPFASSDAGCAGATSRRFESKAKGQRHALLGLQEPIPTASS